MKRITIAIDGYSSCGKGTLAKSLAKELGYLCIDTGAMYRACALYLLEHDIALNELSAVGEALKDIRVGFQEVNGIYYVTLNDEIVEEKIREMRVANCVSEVAAIGIIREKMVDLQRKIGKDGGVVMDGRDVGTVVFPHAELKIFMTASPAVRAERRWLEMVAKGTNISKEEVLENLAHRDQIDSSREHSPLTLTDDYRVLDNSDMDRDEQLALALSWAHAAG